jgi:hypothetical protein
MKHILAGIGFVLILLSVMLLLITIKYKSDAALYLLRAPLPITSGAQVRQNIQVVSPDTYCIDVTCLVAGSLASPDGLNEAYKKIPSDISVTISADEKVIFKQRADLHKNATLTDGRVRYRLSDVDIDKAGQYHLDLYLQKDITILQGTEPMLVVQRSDGVIESSLVIRTLMFIVCSGMSLAGMVLIIGDFLRTRTNKRRAIQHRNQ